MTSLSDPRNRCGKMTVARTDEEEPMHGCERVVRDVDAGPAAVSAGLDGLSRSVGDVGSVNIFLAATVELWWP